MSLSASSSSPASFVEDFKSLSPLSDDSATNSDVGDDDELSELSSVSPCTPNSPIPQSHTLDKLSSVASAPTSLLPLIERPRRLTKRDQLDRLNVLEAVKKTRKLTVEEKKEFQRLRRRKQNRDAAATSRDRKRDYTSSLEGTIKAMRDKQAEMQRQIETLLKEREALLNQAKADGHGPAVITLTPADEKKEGSKRGKKRGLDECVNESAVLSVCSSSSLNSSLPLISSAELALLSIWSGSMANTVAAVPA